MTPREGGETETETERQRETETERDRDRETETERKVLIWRTLTRQPLEQSRKMQWTQEVDQECV